jgi:hypothetical protein
VRERYLRRFAPPLEKAIEDIHVIAKSNETGKSPTSKMDGLARGEGAPLDGGLLLLQQALSAALNRAKAATDAAVLRDAMQRSAALALDIQQVKQQNYNRAIAILLLNAD